MKTDHETMVDAINLIRDIDNWCQGTARKEVRKGLLRRRWQYCAAGAMQTAADTPYEVGLWTISDRPYCRQYVRLRYAFQQAAQEILGRPCSAVSFNDRWLQDGYDRVQVHAEVIQAMEKAAAKLAEEGK